jgi:thiosulfate/3-mercaptopyruvate sulfurtransferase
MDEPMQYTTIIPTEILATHLGDPDWVIIDCRFDLLKPEWGLAEYQAAHIPGAVYANLNRDLSGLVTSQTGRHPLPEPAEMVACFSAWGISKDSQVVVYDTSGGSLAARLWWLLRYFDHQTVAVLDGSFQKWVRESRPTRAGIETRPASIFEGKPKPGLWVTTSEVELIRRNPAYRLIDARAASRFNGEEEFIDPISGHIPGAINRFYSENLDSDGNFLPPARLKAEFEALLAGVPADRAIVYCGSGVTSCHHLVAMEYAGLDSALLYPGSWSEWIRDPNRPIQKKS